jgi:4-hydroxybenzoate polyprenyltransferase
VKTPGLPSSRALAYLQLLRPANVVTALADVLAGYAVAGLPVTPALAWLLLSTACLYAGGIVLNDVFDRHLDATERPERPIPSGKISAGTAGSLGAALLFLGVAAAFGAGGAAGLMALAIAAAVVVYDAWGKHQTVLGPVNMGLCRALNLMLGVAASPQVLSTAWPLGLLPLTYIAAVTVVSRGEVRGGGRPVAWVSFGLVAGVVGALGWLALTAGLERSWTCLIVLMLGWRVLPAFWRVTQTPDPATARLAVRTGVISLVLLDAVIAGAHAGIIYAMAVLLTGLVAARLARRFAVT